MCAGTIYLFVCLSICLSVYLSLCLSFYLSIYLSTYLSIYLYSPGYWTITMLILPCCVDIAMLVSLGTKPWNLEGLMWCSTRPPRQKSRETDATSWRNGQNVSFRSWWNHDGSSFQNPLYIWLYTFQIYITCIYMYIHTHSFIRSKSHLVFNETPNVFPS